MRRRNRNAFWAKAVLLAVLGGCAENNTRECNVGVDCASGVCLSDGTCAELDVGVDMETVDLAMLDTAQLDGDASDSMANLPDAGPEMGAEGGLCSPNRDGRIERSEVTLTSGLRANFASATDVTFDTRGEMVDGIRTWDLAQAFAGEEIIAVDTRSIADEWFASDFVGATYAAELSVDSDLIGIFESTDNALLLRGVVSPDDGFTRTNLENDPPATVLAFPLELDDTWSTEVSVSGVALGVFSIYSESYTSRVDQRGTVLTPFGRFDDVFRVRTELVRTVGIVRTTIVSFAFVSECFGTIATLTGRDNDDGAELDELAELRRLAP
ncbi:MAG: hypothetical protein AAF411_12260 [Myxococcota bacterium]